MPVAEHARRCLSPSALQIALRDERLRKFNTGNAVADVNVLKGRSRAEEISEEPGQFVVCGVSWESAEDAAAVAAAVAEAYARNGGAADLVYWGFGTHSITDGRLVISTFHLIEIGALSVAILLLFLKVGVRHQVSRSASAHDADAALSRRCGGEAPDPSDIQRPA
jgi:hypothetical protein